MSIVYGEEANDLSNNKLNLNIYNSSLFLFRIEKARYTILLVS